MNLWYALTFFLNFIKVSMLSLSAAQCPEYTYTLFSINADTLRTFVADAELENRDLV
jgi:hypothetical protein